MRWLSDALTRRPPFLPLPNIQYSVPDIGYWLLNKSV
jgi:hypothetical protein